MVININIFGLIVIVKSTHKITYVQTVHICICKLPLGKRTGRGYTKKLQLTKIKMKI